MLGQLPEVQIVLSLYLSTRPRNSVYFFPVGSFTRNHFGLGSLSGNILVSILIEIDTDGKDTNEIENKML